MELVLCAIEKYTKNCNTNIHNVTLIQKKYPGKILSS
jgi:hypothetical protein